MEKISCIVPVYNVEGYLNRCVDSILNQTYLNTEIVLIDDGSTDLSGTICDEYAHKHDNITVCHIPNGGASLARKKGLELSSGYYVTFIDSDDFIDRNYLSILYELLMNSGCLISACNVQRIAEKEILDNCNILEVREKLEFEQLMPRFFKYEFWGLCGKLYKKTVFKDIFFPRATLSEDYVIMAQLFYKNKTLIYSPKSLYYYVFHINSLSHTKLSVKAFEEFENVNWVLNYITRNAPEYRSNALSNVVETSVKLLLQKQSDRKKIYVSFLEKIENFIKSHFIEIIQCRKLSTKIKVLLIGIMLFPSLCICFYNNFILRLKKK